MLFARGHLARDEVRGGVGRGDGKAAETDEGDEAEHGAEGEGAEQHIQCLFGIFLHYLPHGLIAGKLLETGVTAPNGEPEQAHDDGDDGRAKDEFPHGAAPRDARDETAGEGYIGHVPEDVEDEPGARPGPGRDLGGVGPEQVLRHAEQEFAGHLQQHVQRVSDGRIAEEEHRHQQEQGKIAGGFAEQAHALGDARRGTEDVDDDKAEHDGELPHRAELDAEEQLEGKGDGGHAKPDHHGNAADGGHAGHNIHDLADQGVVATFTQDAVKAGGGAQGFLVAVGGVTDGPACCAEQRPVEKNPVDRGKADSLRHGAGGTGCTGVDDGRGAVEVVQRFGCAKNDETGSQTGAEQHADPGIEGELGLAVLAAQFDLPEGPVQQHPEGEEDGRRADGKDQPAEIGKDEILYGSKKSAAGFGRHKSKDKDGGKQNKGRPEQLMIEYAQNAGSLGI